MNRRAFLLTIPLIATAATLLGAEASNLADNDLRAGTFMGGDQFLVNLRTGERIRPCSATSVAGCRIYHPNGCRHSVQRRKAKRPPMKPQIA